MMKIFSLAVSLFLLTPLLLETRRRILVESFSSHPLSYAPVFTKYQRSRGSFFGINLRTTSAFALNGSVQTRLTESLAQDEEETSSLLIKEGEEFSGSNPENSRTQDRQLWLDLRTTAIRPNEAITFLNQLVLEDEQSLELSNLIDAVLLSEEGFFEFINSNNKQQGQDRDFYYSVVSSSNAGTKLQRKGNEQPQETKQQGDVLVWSNPTSQQSIPIGTIFTCNRRSMLDPLVFLNASSRYNNNNNMDDNPEQKLQQQVETSSWVLIDSDDHDEESSDQAFSSSQQGWMTDQVSNLVNLLSSSAFSFSDLPSSESPSSSLMFTTDSRTRPRSSTGIAVCCRTPSALFEMDALLSPFHPSLADSTATMSTASGILVPTATTGVEPLTSIVVGQTSRRFSTALVLPFDARLWQTVLEWNRMQHEEPL